MDLIKALELSKKLSKKAGEEILKIYTTDFEVEYKEEKMPLTMADKKSNDIIVEGLKKSFPKVGILSEEMEDNIAIRNNKYCFIVDPLDGTKEFIKKNDEFTVNIALAEDGEVIMGVVYVPVKDELYYALKGNGAYLETNGKAEMIKVSDNIKEIKIVVSKSHISEKEKSLIDNHKNKISEIISAGSSLKGCFVALGRADVYYRFGYTMEWDTAAMHAICEEAGAIVRQMDDSMLLYNRENHLNEKGFYIINNIENLMKI